MKSLIYTISIILVLGIISTNAQVENQPLELNKPIERELASGQTHTYSVNLKAGEFMQVQVEQKGIDVVLSILSADGTKLAEIDSPNGEEGFEILSFIAKTTTNYSVVVKELGQNKIIKQGKYNLVFMAKRTSTDKDTKIIETEKKYQEILKRSESIGNQDTTIKYQEILSIWKNLGEKYWSILILELIDSTDSLEEASRIFDKLSDKANEQRVLKKLGDKYYDSKSWEKSLISFNQALQIAEERGDKTSIDELIDTIRFVIESKEFEENRKQVRELVMQGQSLSDNGKKNDAINQFNKAIEFCNTKKHLERFAITIYEMIGQTYLDLKEIEKAKSIYKNALDFAKKNEFIGYEIQHIENLNRIEQEITLEKNIPQLVVPTGHTQHIWAVDFSPDGKILASGGFDSKIKIWDVSSGKELRTLSLHRESIRSLAFSKTDNLLASASDDGTVMLWNPITGQKIRTLSGHLGAVWCVTFTSDGKLIATGDSLGKIKLWRLNGEFISTLDGHNNGTWGIDYSPDGKTLASSGNDGKIKIWNISDLKNISLANEFNASATSILSLKFSPNGKLLVSGDGKGILKIWNCEEKNKTFLINQFENSQKDGFEDIRSVKFDSNGEKIIVGSENGSVNLWDILKPEKPLLLNSFPNINERSDERGSYSIAISPNNQIIASGNNAGEIDLLDARNLRKLRTLAKLASEIKTINLSSNLKYLSVGYLLADVNLWNLENQHKIKRFEEVYWIFESLNRARNFNTQWNVSAFSNDGRMFGVVNRDSIEIRDNEREKIYIIPLDRKNVDGFAIVNLSISPDGKQIAAIYATENKVETKLWNIEDGKEIQLPNPKPNWIKFNPGFEIKEINGKQMLIYADEAVIKFVELDTGMLYASLILIGNDDWAVVDSEGRWDASVDAQKLMYYVLSTPEGYETIDFSQLKERYYQPDLLQIVLGFKKEQLKDVAQFSNPLLPPAVEPIEPKDDKSTVRQVKLRNRNGGIGRVQVFVNGREYIEDTRDEKLKANPNLAEYVLNFDLKDADFASDQKPDIKVVAWNYDPNAKESYKGYISSRGTEIVYTPPKQDYQLPTLYGIIGGVSDYSGTQLDLRFAAKDAEDIYQAIQVGGKNLFGVEKVKLKLLSTSGKEGSILPTKENFKKVFEEFAKEAKPNDILFVYLSGHGTTLNFGSDTYYYLTQEATTTNKEVLSKDSQLLNSSTINSEELTEWHKAIKAQKQVLILDTCAAGAFTESSKIIEKKDLSADAKRAIERMKDRIGFHVLMGSASDAVSYEASQYGQGLLTYSLLQGMRGAALDTNGQVDVSKLFNYAADTVPNLAKNIGGIQRPELRNGGPSFAVGLLKETKDKEQIPLANIKPVILRPNLQNEKLKFDNLKLAKILAENLEEASQIISRGKDSAKIVFVDTDEMPNAILPAGTYNIEGEIVKLTINLVVSDNVIKTFQVEGNKNNLSEFAKLIVEKISIESANLEKQP